tara:strand:+ start:1122 stop:1697 length:576 start_codon:yes stop_codon:yes gene_type:complete
MKAQDMLNKVKELIGVELQEEVKLAQATLENGTVIESESFEAGSEVFIVSEEDRVALPVGDYTLEDGEILIVQEEGVIASIGAIEEEAPAEEEVEAADEDEKVYATKEELAELKTAIEEIKAIIEKQEMSKVEETTEETVEEKDLELSAVEAPVEKVNHNPEATNDKELNLLSQKKQGNSTMDRVLRRLNN